MSSSLRPHGLQHAMLSCLSLFPGVCSDSCPWSWWCHLTISSSAALFSFYLQSSWASGSLPITPLFTSDGHSIQASASVLQMSIQGLFPLGLIGFISLQSKGLSRDFFSITIWKHQFFGIQLSLWSNFTSIHDYWKTHSFDYMDLLSAKWYFYFLIRFLGLS